MIFLIFYFFKLKAYFIITQCRDLNDLKFLSFNWEDFQMIKNYLLC
jgi:hypothetical protein